MKASHIVDRSVLTGSALLGLANTPIWVLVGFNYVPLMVMDNSLLCGRGYGPMGVYYIMIYSIGVAFMHSLT